METQSEALATIGEIVRTHGDVDKAFRRVARSRIERLIDLWWRDVREEVSTRPYTTALTALAVGLLCGASIGYSATRRRRRYW